MKQINIFAEDNRLNRLSNIGDPLEKIMKTIEFEMFRPILTKAIPREKSNKGGRPPKDNLLMFKILLLQEWYHIADDITEYLINDRLSFQRFLGLSLNDKVPDAKTIWLYREHLKNSGMIKEIFDMFAIALEEIGVITHEGSIVDASFIDVPKQRNNREDNKKIKEGDSVELWKENENKRCQKDIDARWTKKNKEIHYGYKDHVKVDNDSKIIVDFSVTDASVHDSQVVVELINKHDKKLYADSAYVGEDLHDKIKEKSPGIILEINEKAYRSKPLTALQKALNKKKSKVRVRVEHVFGHMTNSMGGMTTRVIGIDRTTCVITMKNLAYNISRWVYLANTEKDMIHI